MRSMVSIIRASACIQNVYNVCVCAVVKGPLWRYDLALACGRAKQGLCCRCKVRLSQQPFTDANINIMIFGHDHSFGPQHTLVHLSLHTLIPFHLHIACLKFAKAEMPPPSTPNWHWHCLEQERHDGDHHPLPASHRVFHSSSLTARATRHQKASAVGFESDCGRPPR